jgi:DNA-binding transcriptional LysR family regulator
MVRSGEVDVAVLSALHDAPGLQRDSLARFDLVLIRADGACTDLPDEVRWIDVAARRLVGFPRDFPVQLLINEQLVRAGRHAPPEVICNYLETQIAMVEVGAGVAVVPNFVAAVCAKRRIAMHPIVDPVVSGDLCWITNRARKLPSCAQGFHAFLKVYFSELAEQWPSYSSRRAPEDRGYGVMDARKAATGS